MLGSRAEVARLKSCKCNHEILEQDLRGLSKEISSPGLINGEHQELVPEAHDSLGRPREADRPRETNRSICGPAAERMTLNRVSASLGIGSRLMPHELQQIPPL